MMPCETKPVFDWTKPQIKPKLYILSVEKSAKFEASFDPYLKKIEEEFIRDKQKEFGSLNRRRNLLRLTE